MKLPGRIVSGLLALLMAISLTACGSADSSTSPTPSPSISKKRARTSSLMDLELQRYYANST